MGVQRVAEHEVRATQPPAALFQQVHRAQVGDGIDPKDAHCICCQHALATGRASFDFCHQVIQDAQGFVAV